MALYFHALQLRPHSQGASRDAGNGDWNSDHVWSLDETAKLASQGDMMTLTLSDVECSALKESLELYLMDLRRQTAATDAHAMQHALAERQSHLEAILARL
jgi:hypothetical protein